jgi:predicted polyphosphate/ATP-dependent NAD kinase
MNSSSDVSRAVVLYLGHGIANYAEENVGRVVEEFGKEKTKFLEREVTDILAELNAITPNWNVHTLESAASWVRDQMKSSHAELDDKALDALEWAFTWWWR